MMKGEEKIMKGSVHEDDLFIVHDALVLMASKGDGQMDEREQLLPSLVDAHEWITRRYTL